MTEEDASPLGWWSISGESLLELLRRVREGEEPDMVYIEAYANSDHEQYGDNAS